MLMSPFGHSYDKPVDLAYSEKAVPRIHHQRQTAKTSPVATFACHAHIYHEESLIQDEQTKKRVSEKRLQPLICTLSVRVCADG